MKIWIQTLDQIQGVSKQKMRLKKKKKNNLYAVLIGNPQKSLYNSCSGESLRFMSIWVQFIQQKYKAFACVYDSPSNEHIFNSNTKETGEGWKGAWCHQGMTEMQNQ